MQLPGFVGVNRIRFESDLDRSGSRTGVKLALHVRLRWAGLLRGKACGLHGTASWAASIALSRSRYTISKTRAGHIAGDTFRSACPVSFSRAGRLIERSERGDLEMSVWFALAGHSVGISKAARLNFADRSIHSHGRRTAEVSGVHDQVRTRAAGLENCCLKLGYGGD